MKQLKPENRECRAQRRSGITHTQWPDKPLVAERLCFLTVIHLLWWRLYPLTLQAMVRNHYEFQKDTLSSSRLAGISWFLFINALKKCFINSPDWLELCKSTTMCPVDLVFGSRRIQAHSASILTSLVMSLEIRAFRSCSSSLDGFCSGLSSFVSYNTAVASMPL